MKYDVVIFTDNAVRFGHVKPLGAYRVASELRTHGYTVKVVDFTCRIILNTKLFKTLLDSLIGDNTLFVGWSGSYFGDYAEFIKEKYTDGVRVVHDHTDPHPTNIKNFNIWLKYTKKQWPQIKHVYGGFYSYKHEELSNEFDYVVVGYADTMVVDLADHLSKKTPIRFSRSFDKKFKILDYDKYSQSYDFPNGLTRFEHSDHMFPGEVVPLETSRGCMFKCKFCAFPLLGRKRTDPGYHRSEDCMTEELRRNWEEFGINKYMFIDHTFNETVGKLEYMLRARDRAKVNLEFTCYLRLDLLEKNPEQIPLLKDLGLKSPFFGIESFNDQSTASIGKGIKSERVKELLHELQDYFGPDYSNAISLIIGLPFETPETFAKGMEWVLDPSSPISACGVASLNLAETIYPSEFALHYGDYGYRKISNDTWENDTWNQNICRTLAEDYRQKLYDSGKVKLGSFEIFGMMTYGYEFADLKDISTKDLPWRQFSTDLENYYIRYITELLKFEKIAYTDGL